MQTFGYFSDSVVISGSGFPGHKSVPILLRDLVLAIWAGVSRDELSLQLL